MQEIVKRLKENRLYEKTKQLAVGDLVNSLKGIYPECEVSYNKDHNCVDVIYDGDIQFQAYLDKTPKERTDYKYELIANHGDIKPGDKVYRRVSKQGRRYDYSADNAIVKSVAKVTNINDIK